MLSSHSLITTITDAFQGVELEDGIGLREADAIDSYADARVRIECRQQDEQHDWSAIPPEALNTYNSSLSFFDAKGFRFHLPAFMIAEIKGEYRFGMAFVFTHLTEYAQSRFAILSREQRAVVRMFLEYLLTHPDYVYEQDKIKLALESYWLE
jgi:hypothetical protein